MLKKYHPQSHWFSDLHHELNRLLHHRATGEHELSDDTSQVATGHWSPQVDIQETSSSFNFMLIYRVFPVMTLRSLWKMAC